MSEIMSKTIRAIHNSVGRDGKYPDKIFIPDYEWEQLREELKDLLRFQDKVLLSDGDCEFNNFLLCGVPVCAEVFL